MVPIRGIYHLIVAVRYTTTSTSRYISLVKIQDARNDSIIGPERIISKSTVINDIQSGQRFFTAYKKNGQLHIGDEVEAVPHNNPTYIRTVGNSKLEDNLGELPEF